MKLLLQSPLILFLFLLNVNDVLAQINGVTVTSDPVYLHITGPDSDNNTDSNCASELIAYNDTSQNIPLQWKKTEIINSQPTWHFHVCDDNNCYLPEVDSAEVVLSHAGSNELTPGLTVFSLGFTDELTTLYDGYAEVEFKITKVDNPSEFETVLFIFDSEGATSVVKEELLSDISVFPNPSKGTVQITGNNSSLIKSLKVYDMVGHEKRSMFYNNGGSFDISSLSSGVYMVLMLDESNKVIGKEMINKL